MVKRRKKSGELIVKEHSCTKGGKVYKGWRVSGTINGQRVRRYFSELQDAKRWKSLKEVEILNGNELRTVATRLTADQVKDAESAQRRLGGRSILEAVSYYLENCQIEAEEVALIDACNAFIKNKMQEKLRPQTITQLESSMGQFRRYVGDDVLIGRISTELVERFLSTKSSAPKTFNNYRADIHNLFEYCCNRRKWLSFNPVEAVNKMKVSRGLPTVLTVKQAAALMLYCESFKNGRLVPFFALCLFAGMRPAEVIRLGRHPECWRFIDLERGIIHVQPEVSKTHEYRQITIQAPLQAFLTAYPGPVMPLNYDRDSKVVRKHAKLTRNVLRHSFISYHVASFKSVGEVALQAGNSEAVVKKHYLNLSTMQEADAFWAIRPAASQQKVVSIA